MSKTIKVRIAVAVDERGGFYASGASGFSDEEELQMACNGLGILHVFTGSKPVLGAVIVTAEIPLPERIAGEAEGRVEG